MNGDCTVMSGPSDCGLGVGSLALTGGMDPTGWLIVAAALVVIGLIFFWQPIVRRLRYRRR